LALLHFENTTIIHLSNFLAHFEIIYVKQENNITIEPREKSWSQSQLQLQSKLESQENEKIIESNTNKRKETQISTTATTATTSKKRSKQPKIVEVVRNKEERKSLIGHSCPQCIDFYENLFGKDTEKCREAIQLCSRHRTRYKQQPGTPPGYWDVDIHTPEEWKIQDEELAKRQEEKAYEENTESKQSQQSQQSQDTLLE
jgi:hypothetical protein